MAGRGLYVSSAVSSGSEAAGGGGAKAGTDSFLACPASAFGPVAVVRVAAAAEAVVAAAVGRVLGGLAEGPREARGARVVAASAAARVVEGRFAVAVAVAAEDESEGLDVGFPGDGRAAAVDATAGLRTGGFFLLSSPDVTDDRSGSWSEAVLDDEIVLRAAVPGAGRVGGLLRLDPPTALARVVEAAGGLTALVEVRVVVV